MVSEPDEPTNGSAYALRTSESVAKRPLSLLNTLAQVTASSASRVVVFWSNERQKYESGDASTVVRDAKPSDVRS